MPSTFQWQNVAVPGRVPVTSHSLCPNGSEGLATAGLTRCGAAFAGAAVGVGGKRGSGKLRRDQAPRLAEGE